MLSYFNAGWRRLARAGMTPALAGLLVAGCATAPPEPVLYPNTHLKQVGSQAAQREIAECKQLALASGVDETKKGDVAGKAAGGAAVGGAAG
ncbi:MAG: hypothetical protein PVI50_05955, partial [Gammaproteobacteria bacterium]